MRRPPRPPPWLGKVAHSAWLHRGVSTIHSCKLLAAKRCACCKPPHANRCPVTWPGCHARASTTRSRIACQQGLTELVSSRALCMLGMLWCRCFLSVMVQSEPSPPRCCGLLLACQQRAAVASRRL